MNLVSLIMRFLRADMTGRIASALGLDHTAKRSMLIACSAICLGLAFPTSSFAQRKNLATCEKEWSANKAFNQAAGITERDWVAKCRAESAKSSPATGGYPPVARGAGGKQVAPGPNLRVSTTPSHPTTRHQRRRKVVHGDKSHP